MFLKSINWIAEHPAHCILPLFMLPIALFSVILFIIVIVGYVFVLWHTFMEGKYIQKQEIMKIDVLYTVQMENTKSIYVEERDDDECVLSKRIIPVNNVKIKNVIGK